MVGICGRVAPGGASAPIGPMLDQMRSYAWYAEESHGAAGVGLGLCALSKTDLKFFCAAESGDVAILTGEIYDSGMLRRKLAADGVPFVNGDQAEICLRGFQRSGERFFRSLNGKFALAIWESARQTLTLVTDRFGMRPLYFAETEGGLVFATEIKALLAAHVARRTDDAAVAQFFTFHQFVGESTAIAGVRRLGPGNWARFDPKNGRLRVEPYWDANELTAGATANSTDALERIDHAFSASVRRCSDETPGLGLALSGGLDSRCILGLVRPEQPVTCVTLGLPGAMDLWVAERMAQVMHRPHHRFTLGKSFFRDYENTLRHMVHFTEAQIPATGITVPTLALYRELGVKVVLRGHGGELMHMGRAYKYSLGPDALAVNSAQGLEAWLYRQVVVGLAGTPDMGFLTARYRALAEPGARKVVKGWIDDLAGIEPAAHRFWLLFVKHHLPQSVAASIVKFNSVVETRTPYIDADLLSALLAVSPEMKLRDRIQKHILDGHAPELLAAPNTNTGIGMGARPELVKVAQFAVKVMSKLGVPGFQPYERIGLWLRREFYPLVESTLLSDQCLDRGIFDRAGTRAVIDEHRSQRKNHTNLLMAMMCFETAQRELIDGQNLMGSVAASAANSIPAAPGLVLQPQ